MKSAIEEIKKIEEILKNGIHSCTKDGYDEIDWDKWDKIKDICTFLYDMAFEDIKITYICDDFRKFFMPYMELFEEFVEEENEEEDSSYWYADSKGAYKCLNAFKRVFLPGEMNVENHGEDLATKQDPSLFHVKIDRDMEISLADFLSFLKKQANGWKYHCLIHSHLRGRTMLVNAEWDSGGWIINTYDPTEEFKSYGQMILPKKSLARLEICPEDETEQILYKYKIPLGYLHRMADCSMRIYLSEDFHTDGKVRKDNMEDEYEYRKGYIEDASFVFFLNENRRIEEVSVWPNRNPKKLEEYIAYFAFGIKMSACCTEEPKIKREKLSVELRRYM